MIYWFKTFIFIWFWTAIKTVTEKNLWNLKTHEKKLEPTEQCLVYVYSLHFSVSLSVLTLRIDFKMYNPINSNDVFLGHKRGFIIKRKKWKSHK